MLDVGLIAALGPEYERGHQKEISNEVNIIEGWAKQPEQQPWLQ